MPFYPGLKRPPFSADERARVAERLLMLRQQIRNQVPGRSVTDTLLLATWNIRDFDSNKFGHGPRLPESFYYIAEIIASFDLVAVQEVNDLEALEKVVRILGPSWDYIVTDVTAGRSGNNERMAFIFDRGKILFKKLVGEIVLPDNALIGGKRQFARTPFFVSFQAGWFKFSLCTVHIYYGSESGEELERRIAEIDTLAAFLAERAERESGNFILLGDFNIVSPEHRTMDALTRHGFEIPKALQGSPSNMFRTKHYDQIAFKVQPGQLQVGEHKKAAGALDYYETLFTKNDFQAYDGALKGDRRRLWDQDDKGRPRSEAAKRTYYEREWRTWQMSDHLPMWVELKIDFSDGYLSRLVRR